MVKPPPGPYAAGLLVPQWLLIGTCFVIIALRLNLRLRIQRIPLMASDYLMCCAWLSAVATASFDIVFARMGVLDPDMDYFLSSYQGPPEDIEYILKLLWASQFPFYMTFYFAKAALLSIYLRLFPPFMRKRRFVLWMVIIYCAVAFAVTMLSTLLICRPIEGNWSLDPEVTCDGHLVVLNFIVSWSLHFSGDLMIFVVPFMVLNQLQLKRALKVGVYCTFFLGIINIAFCLTRFLTLQGQDFTSPPSLSLVELWSALDCNISVLVASLPSLRPYFRGSIWRGYISSITGGRFGHPDKSGASHRSGKSSGLNRGAPVPQSFAARRVDPEAGFAFSEEDYPYTGPHGPGGGLAAKHQISRRADASYQESPLDDASGKLSTGDSDIELVMQGSRHPSHGL